MTVIARWDSFREFTTLQSRMNRLFCDSFGSDGRDEALTSTGFAPPADVYEDDHSITVKIKVPAGGRGEG